MPKLQWRNYEKIHVLDGTVIMPLVG